MSIEKRITVTEIQRFCMHDGPGVRTTVFLKGCPLRCAWCHNPETQRSRAELLLYGGKCIGCGACVSTCPAGAHGWRETHTVDRDVCRSCGVCAANCPSGALELCGREMTVEEILSIVEKDRAFYGENGGVTLSGGEPFLQGEGALALLQACKERGFSTAVETCGYADADVLIRAVPLVDLFLWDIKDTDGERHRRYTGVTNERILANLSLINEREAAIRLRCILVNGVNTSDEYYRRVAELARGIRRLDVVEWIAYHAYAGTKTIFLGGEDSGRRDWIPDAQQIERAREVLREQGIRAL